MINRDLGLNLRIDQENLSSNISRKSFSRRVIPKVTTEPPKRYDFTSKAFSQRELMFWFRYGITEEVLHRFHVKALTCFRSVNREGKPYSIYSNEEEPMRVYGRGQRNPYYQRREEAIAFDHQRTPHCRWVRAEMETAYQP